MKLPCLLTLAIFATTHALAAQPLNCMPTYDAGVVQLEGELDEADPVLRRRTVRRGVGMGAGGIGGCVAGYAASRRLTPEDEGMVGLMLCGVVSSGLAALGWLISNHAASSATKERERHADRIPDLYYGLVAAKGFLAASDLLVNYRDTATPEQLNVAIDSLLRLQWYSRTRRTISELAARII